MQAYQVRVIEEKQELDQKIVALQKFLISTNSINIDPTDLLLLQTQHRIMNEYSNILLQRIERFEP